MSLTKVSKLIRWNLLSRLALVFSLLVFTSMCYAKTYVAGTTPSSAPNAFLDTKTGNISGFMPEVAQKIADESGFDLEFKVMPFSALIQSVKSGKIDMIVAGMSPTEKRAKVVDFSNPVAGLGHTIFVRDDNKKKYTGPNDFSGQVIGISAGTDYADYIRSLNVAKKINFYDGLAQMESDVRNGRISVGMSDDTILKYMDKNGQLKGMHVVESYKQETPYDPIALAVKKGNTELLKKINSSIEGLRASGELKKLQEKWGEGPVPTN